MKHILFNISTNYLVPPIIIIISAISDGHKALEMNSKDADLEAKGSNLRVGLLKSRGDGDRLVINKMLWRHAGEMGRWQLRHFMMTCLAWSLEAFHTMVMIFAADREPAWRCSSGLGFCPPNPFGLGSREWGWINGAGVSTVTEWGLVCGEKYKVGLVQSAFFLGCMIAGMFAALSMAPHKAILAETSQTVDAWDVKVDTIITMVFPLGYKPGPL